jgi:pSer/pThr/pTyr-binding forkhead associated (FHA) protein
VKTILPYIKVHKSYDSFTRANMSDVVRDGLDWSNDHPCYLAVTNEEEQYYLFLREKQIYSAGRMEGGAPSDLTIKDFLLTASGLENSQVDLFEVNSKILHSILILFQKQETLKVLTSLVDLDQILDKIEEERRSCIVSASQDSFLAALRYEKGKVTALCHEQSSPQPNEGTFREDFLVKIYTLSAERPLEIRIYDDLLVKYAKDAKPIDDSYHGDIIDLFLTKPPTVTLEFKGREIGHWVLEKASLNIGRTADNDIQVDNLAVSRLHAVIEKDKGHYYIKDCDSLNGTVLNGKRVGRARLVHGDEIVIGKHKLVYQNQTGKTTSITPDIAPFDQTVVITPGQKPPMPNPSVVEMSKRKQTPRLVETTKRGKQVFELKSQICVLGKDEHADIELGGMFIAKQHAEIVKENGDYVIRHTNGRRGVTVEGKKIKERVLKDNDAIKIGNREFIFQE